MLVLHTSFMSSVQKPHVATTVESTVLEHFPSSQTFLLDVMLWMRNALKPPFALTLSLDHKRLQHAACVV